jgi:hypothetical protein
VLLSTFEPKKKKIMKRKKIEKEILKYKRIYMKKAKKIVQVGDEKPK